MNKIFLSAILIVQIIFLLTANNNAVLLPKNTFNKNTIDLKLADLIHNDFGMAPLLVRLFHNKAEQTIIGIYNSYLAYWETNFMVRTQSILGFLGVVSGFYYLVLKKSKRAYLLILIFLSIPLLLIIFPGLLRLPAVTVMLFLPRGGLALYGLAKLKESHQTHSKIVYFLLLLLLVINACYLLVYPYLIKLY